MILYAVYWVILFLHLFLTSQHSSASPEMSLYENHHNSLYLVLTQQPAGFYTIFQKGRPIWPMVQVSSPYIFVSQESENQSLAYHWQCRVLSSSLTRVDSSHHSQWISMDQLIGLTPNKTALTSLEKKHQVGQPYQVGWIRMGEKKGLNLCLPGAQNPFGQTLGITNQERAEEISPF